MITIFIFKMLFTLLMIAFGVSAFIMAIKKGTGQK